MKNYKLTSGKTNETLFSGSFKDFKTCLEEAVKRRIPLPYVTLKGQNLSNANLDDGIFPHAEFAHTNLSGANISESYCKSANFTGASLFNTCFAHTNLTSTNFNDAYFGATDMSGAILDRAQFSTLSAFTIDFSQTRQMRKCTFTNIHGFTITWSTPPIVINGLYQTPVIITENAILNGHTPLNAPHPLLSLKELTTNTPHSE